MSAEMTLEQVRDEIRALKALGYQMHRDAWADAIDAHLANAGGGVDWPTRGRVWERRGEWVFELEGTYNDTAFISRHTEPLIVPQLPAESDPNPVPDFSGMRPAIEAAIDGWFAGREDAEGNELVTIRADDPRLTQPRSVGVPDGWQDISTAPNDGTSHVRGLHVYGPDGKYLYWEEVAGHIDTEDGAFYSEGDICGWAPDDFTHWHALAATPAPGKGGE